MKTLGLIGGTSWVSTIDYYRLINEGVNRGLGGNGAARCVIHSFNFADIQAITFGGDWNGLLAVVGDAAQNLERIGAQGLVLCANTLHAVADGVAERVKIPVVHIVDVTAQRIAESGADHVALLGTRFTMEMDFFKDRLARHKISVVVPNDEERAFIHASIFSDLAKGIVPAATKQRYLDIIGRLGAAGAQGAILGCTEIPLVVKPSDTPLPLYDTTAIHADAAVAFALS